MYFHNDLSELIGGENVWGRLSTVTAESLSASRRLQTLAGERSCRLGTTSARFLQLSQHQIEPCALVGTRMANRYEGVNPRH